MKNIFFTICALLIISYTSSNAQPGDIQDTITTVTYEQFNVPGERYIVLSNIIDINVSAELLDENYTTIKSIDNIYQFPGKSEFPVSGSRGTTVQISVRETIEQTGTYYVKVNLDFRSEVGSRNVPAYYKVIVNNPTMLAPVKIKERYYFSEKESFSFATAEFSNPNGYSYRIEDAGGGEITSGNGAIVQLDEILNEIDHVGKSLKVIGLYQGKQFTFKSTDGSVGSSSWEFRIAQPNLEEFTDWKGAEDQEINVSAWNQNAMRFLFTYIGATENGFVVVYPEASGLRVTSQPSGAIVNSRSSKSGSFLYVTFNMNPAFLDTMEECGQETVTIQIQFRTQFGENVTKEYTATVLK